MHADDTTHPEVLGPAHSSGTPTRNLTAILAVLSLQQQTGAVVVCVRICSNCH